MVQAGILAFCVDMILVLTTGTVMVCSATGKTLKPWDPDTLAFEVSEVLKGEHVPGTLAIPGVMVDWDDIQMGTMPLLSHRTRYSEGACITSFYRTGAEYLLLLQHRPDDPRPAGLTPYWVLLAPTNEQITGPHDPWADWVRNELRHATADGEVPDAEATLPARNARRARRHRRSPCP
ncbi:MAG TPA: hypothetical protein VFJ16_15345 [Longimicrobium sp.]|nr:hypothetical protein [Longimicrobium sp.]